MPASIASGEPIVVGVLSRAADDGESCVDAIYARTDAFKNLLVDGANQAAKAGGYPLPTWARPGGTTSTPPVEEEPTGETTEPPATSEGSAPAAGLPRTTKTAGGCSAAPGNVGRSWVPMLLAAAFIKRRRRSHSPM